MPTCQGSGRGRTAAAAAPPSAPHRLREGTRHPEFVQVTITAGSEEIYDGHGGWLVPKLDLVGGLQVLLQEKRRKVAESLAEAGTLVRELTNFRVKPLPANTTDPFGGVA